MRSATCRRYVYSTRGSETPTCCPPTTPRRGAPFTRQGPRRTGSPTPNATMRHSDTLRTVRPRFATASLGRTIPRLCLLRSGPTPAWGQGPSGLAVPSRQLLSRWSRRGSQVPREPLWTYAVFSDPGRTGRTSPLTVRRCCPRCVKDEGSSGYDSRGSIARPWPWLSTLRHRPYGADDARLASGGWLDPAEWDWLPTGFLRKVSVMVTPSPSSSPELPGAMTPSAGSPRGLPPEAPTDPDLPN